MVPPSRQDPYWPGPKLNIWQVGRLCGEDLPAYQGCWEMRSFIEGVDYWDGTTGQLIGCVARRKGDGRIFAAPDWRFCSLREAFDILWLQERRKKKQEGGFEQKRQEEPSAAGDGDSQPDQGSQNGPQ